jgi:hypothetical protein
VALSGPALEKRGFGPQTLELTIDTKTQKVRFQKFGDLFQGTYTPQKTEIRLPGSNLSTSTLEYPRRYFLEGSVERRKELHYQAYFFGYAFWCYFNAPFCFSLPGFVTRELSSHRRENGEVWRVLEVVFPEEIHAHTKVQRQYFDDKFRLRRMDYSVEIADSGPMAHYCYDHAKSGNLLIPRFRHANFDSPGFSLGNAFVLHINSVEVHTITEEDELKN